MKTRIVLALTTAALAVSLTACGSNQQSGCFEDGERVSCSQNDEDSDDDD